MTDPRGTAAARLRAIVLGAAAGGGFPQWNCNCRNCSEYWRGASGLTARTQSSLAVSADGENWAVVNASPDIRQQIQAARQLRPRAGARRDSPIASVLLTNGDIDHVAGLLSLREKQPFRLFATAEILEVLAANPVFNALDPNCVHRVSVRLGDAFEILPGVRATLYAVPGKVPLYLEGETVVTDQEGEQTVGVELTGPDDARIHYIPGCARMSAALAARLERARIVFFDGTVWTDDEMIREGVGTKTGARMGHMAMSGPEGSIAAFRNLDARRKISVHINNTNPVLRDGSPERAEAEFAGWEIAHDGMEVWA